MVKISKKYPSILSHTPHRPMPMLRALVFMFHFFHTIVKKIWAKRGNILATNRTVLVNLCAFRPCIHIGIIFLGVLFRSHKMCMCRRKHKTVCTVGFQYSLVCDVCSVVRSLYWKCDAGMSGHRRAFRISVSASHVYPFHYLVLRVFTSGLVLLPNIKNTNFVSFSYRGHKYFTKLSSFFGQTCWCANIS